MKEDEINTQYQLISPPIFQRLGVRGFFTTKAFNGDLKTISNLAGVPVSSLYHPIQRHTDKVIVLANKMERKVADAVITLRTDVFIGVDVADCVPILLYDKRLKAVGAVHAGWRGTASMILKKTVMKMTEEFGSSPLDIVIALGPAIKGCCYEVGEEVIEAVEKATGGGNYYEQKAGKYHLDLQSANILQALESGILSNNIWASDYCTFCNPEKFYSYRYAKGKTGRQSGYIGALNEKHK